MTLQSENNPQGEGIQGFCGRSTTGGSKNKLCIKSMTSEIGNFTYFQYTSTERITDITRWTTTYWVVVDYFASRIEPAGTRTWI